MVGKEGGVETGRKSLRQDLAKAVELERVGSKSAETTHPGGRVYGTHGLPGCRAEA